MPLYHPTLITVIHYTLVSHCPVYPVPNSFKVLTKSKKRDLITPIQVLFWKFSIKEHKVVCCLSESLFGCLQMDFAVSSVRWQE